MPETDLAVFCALAKLRYSIFRSKVRKDTKLDLDRGLNPGLLSGATVAEENAGISLRYEVYKPSANFAKSRRGKPDFVVATCSPNNAVPCLR